MGTLTVQTGCFTGILILAYGAIGMCSYISIAKTWENVNTDHADVKELIPEFYQPPGDFLVNSMVEALT